MKQERWSGFDKFVVMADKASGYVKSDYPAYLDFTVLKSVMENIGKGHDPTNYYHDGETINLGITKGNMLKALDRMFKNVWDNNLDLVVRRLGLRNLRTR